ncbi:monovalent cation/H(+) antiporter subunit G [Neomegalonema sp.]|uniref:monovalent cation/H(+) antiporter subunit G n=1 Tax=Neomegalonema sp. TaxID=2039713 RepID=UPI00261E2769|nr:monovalent cation/H(+) antiporter subunit G [Neomegalonema sp.]MDD2868521.1 monovalent cation/H(+) antiporter subunit G [Neomegalonema sp.]
MTVLEVDIPAWAALLTAALVLFGSTLALIGCIGLLKFSTFYERLHAPTLGSTLGLWSVLIGSMVFFSAHQTRPVVYELLIGIFVTVTTPVTMLLLSQTTLYRDRLEGRDPLSENPDPIDKTG